MVEGESQYKFAYVFILHLLQELACRTPSKKEPLLQALSQSGHWVSTLEGRITKIWIFKKLFDISYKVHTLNELDQNWTYSKEIIVFCD